MLDDVAPLPRHIEVELGSGALFDLETFLFDPTSASPPSLGASPPRLFFRETLLTHDVRVSKYLLTSTHGSLGFGEGVHTFQYEGDTFIVSCACVGPPVGTQHGSLLHRRCSLLGPSIAAIERLFRALVEKAAPVKTHISLMHYSKNERWVHEVYLPTRAAESLVLDATMFSNLMDDLLEFASPEASVWYDKYSIPNRRGYLFYGPPGTGKTSLVHVIASKLQRSICVIDVTNPGFCDRDLHMAIRQLPAESIIVFEDVDALFTRFREAATKAVGITFAGLLNAIDGIGRAFNKKTIFIFTTNHIEELDAALRRPGRIDRTFYVGAANKDEQLRTFFARFYPESTNETIRRFLENLRSVCPSDGALTPAILQNFFLMNRKRTADETADDVAGMRSVCEQHTRGVPPSASSTMFS